MLKKNIERQIEGRSRMAPVVYEMVARLIAGTICQAWESPHTTMVGAFFRLLVIRHCCGFIWPAAS